jgi:hypothetical protein
MQWKISKWNYVYNGKSHLRTDIAICDVIIALNYSLVEMDIEV